MESDIKATRVVHPIKMALWLFILTIVMFFAAYTSATLVRMGEGDWDAYNMPIHFYISTVVVVLCSVLIQMASAAAKKNQTGKVKTFVLATAAFGVVFLVLQYLGWQVMGEQQVYFSGGNISGSFFYVITVAHWVHLISAMIFLAFLVASVFGGRVHSKNMLRIEMCATYWHFLDGLWVYLFFFLLYTSAA